jgi:hypothetical protein
MVTCAWRQGHRRRWPGSHDADRGGGARPGGGGHGGGPDSGNRLSRLREAPPNERLWRSQRRVRDLRALRAHGTGATSIEAIDGDPGDVPGVEWSGEPIRLVTGGGEPDCRRDDQLISTCAAELLAGAASRPDAPAGPSPGPVATRLPANGSYATTAPGKCSPGRCNRRFARRGGRTAPIAKYLVNAAMLGPSRAEPIAFARTSVDESQALRDSSVRCDHLSAGVREPPGWSPRPVLIVRVWRGAPVDGRVDPGQAVENDAHRISTPHNPKSPV